YTIKGVQKLHRELGAKRFVAGAAALPPTLEGPAPAKPRLRDGADQRGLREALAELEAAKARLDELLREG
ncbi:MAG TPA: MerR family transcriptional regulator, partial [Caulobacteraceae bacterium]|nr:MerR family transcriptional regulator [Caulobacteraceae bacterium]